MEVVELEKKNEKKLSRERGCGVEVAKQKLWSSDYEMDASE